MLIKCFLKTLLVFILLSVPSFVQANSIEVIPVTVVKVVDVGTIIVEIDGKEELIRLNNVQRPERLYGQPVPLYEQEALKYAKELLEGKTVYLEFDVSKYDRYRRMLAYVWLQKPSDNINLELKGNMFNALMLLNGHVKIETTPPNMKYIETLLGYQAEAKRKKLGLWAANK